MQILGIDIGGSGVKGAPVDIETGKLTADRVRIATPIPSKPRAVAGVVAEIAGYFGWTDAIGCGFPAIVRNGVTMSAANVHKSWIGDKAERRFSEATGCPVRVINDADAAGLAEMAFGAGQGQMGTVMVITIGTGLGTALFREGILVPNCEFGHIEIDAKDAEALASDAVRKEHELSWKQWAKRFNRYLQTLESLISPDLFILGGGGSKKFDRYADHLNLSAEVLPAEMLNDAGIVGAAYAAKDLP